MRRNFGRNSCLGEPAYERTVRRHPVDTAETGLRRIEPKLVLRQRKQFTGTGDNVEGKAYQACGHLRERPSGQIAAMLRCGYKDDTPDEREWLHEQHAVEEVMRLVAKLHGIERLGADLVPERRPGIDRDHLGQKATLAMTDDDHLPQRPILSGRIQLLNRLR